MPHRNTCPAPQTRPPAARRGVAAVEFAVVLPLLALFVAGIAEFGRALTARQVLNDAARRACRAGALPNRDTAAITAEVQQVLTDNGLNAAAATITVLVNGQSVDAATAVQDDQICVQVSVPFSQVAWVPALFMSQSSVVSATLVMRRQG
jgi:Flp pilus assembly protein TadG